MTLSSYTHEEQKMIKQIKKKTKVGNLDNISRTLFYRAFFRKYPDIRWSLLASMVSRNAGWNMTDLESETFRRMIPTSYRAILFQTYERANWLIFSDAYPQLLVYEASKQHNKPLFHLLKAFHVSSFMEKEWKRFWAEGEKQRLCTSLIINEQHVIQAPVVEQPFFKRKVFHSIPFYLEEYFHFSSVLFPTCQGKLYGFSVYRFQDVRKRILLGKRLAWLLFLSPHSQDIQSFALRVPHTGSRRDYETYVRATMSTNTPMLRMVYPMIIHDIRRDEDWYNKHRKTGQYYGHVSIPRRYDLTEWYTNKRKQLYVSMKLEEFLLPKNFWKLFRSES